MALGSDTRNSVTYALSLLTPLANGLDSDAGPLHATSLYQSAGSTPNNTAIHHDTVYSRSFYNRTTREHLTVDTQYYMGGAVGFTGFGGNTADQIIANLQKTVAGDGTKPVGTIYFENNGDVRSTTRAPYWSETQPDLTARGINYIQENNVSGATPRNRSDVRGAVVGLSTLTLPNGSTYLPGSWADNLTSYGATFDNRSQTKATAFIAAGAGGTSGTITEPRAYRPRFTHSDIHVHIADGSTLGEAFFKSVETPDLQMFLGDSLAQPYADVPNVTATGVTNGQTVSGLIQLDASASLDSPTVATGIAQMSLYIDGKKVDGSVIAGDNGSFNIDTAGLSDGKHELRVVATNNAPAESSGAYIQNIYVDNHNRSVAVTSGDLSLTSTQTAAVNVNANVGDGSVARIELRQLGRVIGTVNAASGSVNIDASQLAYGDNAVTPVAVFSDNSEVAGDAFNVTRNFDVMAGHEASETSEVGWRQGGIKVEYFAGKGAATVDASDYSGTADVTQRVSTFDLFSGRTYDVTIVENGETVVKTYNYSRLTGGAKEGPTSMELDANGLDPDQLAIRATAKFEIDASDTGEYAFYFYNTNDAAQLFIDGEKIIGFDNMNGGMLTQFVPLIYLGEGEHDLTVLAANLVTSYHPDYFDLSLMFRGPDGVTQIAGDSFFYTIPEPSVFLLFAALAAPMLMTRRPGGRGQ